jgi:hypothetical protein
MDLALGQTGLNVSLKAGKNRFNKGFFIDRLPLPYETVTLRQSSFLDYSADTK